MRQFGAYMLDMLEFQLRNLFFKNVKRLFVKVTGPYYRLSMAKFNDHIPKILLKTCIY